MEEETTYWKVLTRNRNSCIVQNIGTAVHYPLNVWIRPHIKGSKLLIFEDYKSSQYFIEGLALDDYIIVPCYAKYVVKVEILPRAFYVALVSHISHLEAFWKKKICHKRLSEVPDCGDLKIAPKGSLGASMVKCLL